MTDQESTREKSEALAALEQIARDSKLSEEEIEQFVINLEKRSKRK